jgi:hypothetical protein
MAFLLGVTMNTKGTACWMAGALLNHARACAWRGRVHDAAGFT